MDLPSLTFARTGKLTSGSTAKSPNTQILAFARCLQLAAGQVQRFRFFGGGLGVTDAEFAIAEHKDILSAFAIGDSTMAGEAMKAHIHNVKQRALIESRATHLSALPPEVLDI